MSHRVELGTSNVPGRSKEWVAHQNVPPEWSAVPQQTVIEIVHQGCLEDPHRPVLIVEDGLAITRKDFLGAARPLPAICVAEKAGDNVA